MKIFLTILAFTTLSNIYGQNVTYDQKNIFKTKFDYAVPVLNVATFHMGGTFDASSTEFDEFNEKNQIEVRRVAKLLA